MPCAGVERNQYDRTNPDASRMSPNWKGTDRRKYVRTPKPPCPVCGSEESVVIDSGREYSEDFPVDTFIRRRQCDRGHKFYTGESTFISRPTICGDESST
jgi:hypothetical protein